MDFQKYNIKEKKKKKKQKNKVTRIIKKIYEVYFKNRVFFFEK